MALLRTSLLYYYCIFMCAPRCIQRMQVHTEHTPMDVTVNWLVLGNAQTGVHLDKTAGQNELPFQSACHLSGLFVPEYQNSKEQVA